MIFNSFWEVGWSFFIWKGILNSFMTAVRKEFILKLLVLFFLTGSLSTVAQAQTTISTIRKGNFSDPKTWNLNRVPTSLDHVIIAHHVNFNLEEFWLGQFGKRDLTIEQEGALVGAGKLVIPANNSKLLNKGQLDVGRLQFGVNGLGTDSAFLENHGVAHIRNNDEYQRGAILNSGKITLYGSVIFHNISYKGSEGSSAVFMQNMHLNAASLISNYGLVEVLSKTAGALTINAGILRNYGDVQVKGTVNLASGTSATTTNYLHNYKNFVTNSVYLNQNSSLTNWGNFVCTYDFINNQGKVINQPCAYLEQSAADKALENRNSGAVFTNNGFVKVLGNFTNMAQAVFTGKGVLHVQGYSLNSDQAKVEGTLCVLDNSAISNNKILDEPTRNNATVATSVTACSTANAPSCPPGGYGNMECKASDECFDFIFHGFIQNGNNTVTLTFSVKTNCGYSLSNVAFELPAGVRAINPKNLTSSFKYTVENTTNDPFHSVKFEAKTAEQFKDGAEDGFSFTLTNEQFDNMGSFRVQAKAGNTVGEVLFSNTGCCLNNVTISGPANACVNSIQAFTAPLVLGTTYSWVIPSTWTLLTGQGTNTITVQVGTVSGSVSLKQGFTSCGSKKISVLVPGTIITQPTAVTVGLGEPAIFSVVATGSNLTYQWQVKSPSGVTWVNIPGATSVSYQIGETVLEQTNSQYRVVINDSCGNSIISQPATLKVIPKLAINIKVFLEGPYNPNTGVMSTTLNASGYLPLEQPFNFGSYKYAGTEKVEAGFFAKNPDIVDWVLVEIRTALDPRQIISKKACFLKKDGFVVDLDGKSLPHFLNVVAGGYFIQVNHRNHIPIISKSLVNLTAVAPLYDFGQDETKASGIFPQKKVKGLRYVMYAADGNGDASVTTADWNECWIRDKGKTGYQNSDYNLDGIVDILDYRLMWLPNNGKVTQTPR